MSAHPPRGTAVGAIALLALVACAGRPTDADRCVRLAKQQQWDQAIPTCERAFAATSRPLLGVTAARAHLARGHADDVLRLAGALLTSEQAADAHQLIGRIQFQRGDDAGGRRELDLALHLHQQAGQHEAAVTDAVVLHTYAYRAGRYRDAIALTEVAEREAAAAAADPSSRARASTARADALMARGDLYVAIGATADAAPLYQEAARLFGDDARKRAHVAVRQGLLEANRGNLAMARAAYAQARGSALAAGADALAAHASINLADVALRDGRLDDAAHDLADARASLPASDWPSTPILFNQADVELRRGRLAEAEAALAEAAATSPDPEWQWQIDHLAGTIAARRGDRAAAGAAYRRAIAVIEHERGGVDSDLLKSTFLDERRGPYERLFALEVEAGDLVGAVATMERLAARTFLDAFVSAGAGGGSEGRAAIDAALARSEQLGELLPAVQGSPVLAAIDPDELLAALRDDVVLSYLEVGDTMWCVVIAGGVPRAFPLAAKLAELRTLVDRLLVAPDDDAAAARLGDALLPGPLGPLPAGTVHVVPAATLARVPFALLRRGGVRLLDQHRFVYVPSASALIALRRRDSGAMAPPVVLADSRGDLAGAASEAARVAAALGVEAAIGNAATADRLRAAAHARVLHVATHSGVDSRGGWIALAGEDVRSDQILGWRLAPALVVLASCASAATTRREYWGSLGAAFLASGSRAVVASLWSVDDQATAAFMEAFYRGGGDDDPAEALARAQRALARSHPSGRGARSSSSAPTRRSEYRHEPSAVRHRPALLHARRGLRSTDRSGGHRHGGGGAHVAGVDGIRARIGGDGWLRAAEHRGPRLRERGLHPAAVGGPDRPVLRAHLHRPLDP